MYRIKAFFNELHQLQTFAELECFLWPDKISFLSFITLAFLMISPLYVLVHILAPINNDPFTLLLNNMTRIDEWVTILIQVGSIGLILGFVSLLHFLISSKKSFRKLILEYKEISFLSLFILWAILSSLLNKDFSIIWMGAMVRQEGLYAYLMYAGIFALALLIHYKKHILFLFKLQISVASILVLLSLINIESINSFLNINALSSVFFNQNHFAYYLAISSSISSHLYLEEKKIFYLISFSILVLGLCLNGSFGPFLALVVSFSLYIVFLYKFKKERKQEILIIYGVFVVVVLITNLFTHSFLNDLLRLGHDVNDIVNVSENAGSAGSARWQLWQNALKFISQKPLLGYGIDNLGQAYAKVKLAMDRPHNEFLQFAASMGLPALVFYLSALGSIFIKWVKQIQSASLYKIALFFIALTYVISSFFGNTMIYTFPYYVVILALLIKALTSADENG